MTTVTIIKNRQNNSETTFVLNTSTKLLRSVCGQAEGFSELDFGQVQQHIHDSFFVDTHYFLHYNNEWWCKVNDTEFFVPIQDSTLTTRYSAHLKNITEYKVLDISQYEFTR